MEENIGLYKNILDSLNDGVYYVDLERRITYWNRGAERITGYPASEVVGRHCYDNILLHVDEKGTNLCKGICLLSRTIADGRSRDAEMYLYHRDGHRLPVLVKAIPIRDSEQRIAGAVEIFSDNSPKISVRHKIEQLEKLSLIEPVTLLMNRKYVEMNIRARFDELFRYGWPFGVLCISMDNLNKINEEYGHGMSDKVLKVVARTLLFNSRTSDVIGRWTQDEFAAIIVNANSGQLHAAADRARMLVEKSAYPHGEEKILFTVSVGATLAQLTDTPDELFVRAEQLMRQSRRAGGNCVTVR